MDTGLLSAKLTYIGLMAGLWFAMFLILGRLMFFDSWSKFARSLIYAFLVPWGVAAIMGDLQEDIESDYSVLLLLVLSVAFVISLHAGMGGTIQGWLGIPVGDSSASIQRQSYFG